MPTAITLYQQKTDFFKQLHTLYHSGIDLLEILRQLQSQDNNALKKPIKNTIKRINLGKSWTEAARDSQLIDQLEYSLINAADNSGTLDSVFLSLANDYAAKASHARKLRSRLMLPAGILILAGFISPLPALILGNITTLHYLFKSISQVGFILIFIFVLMRIPGWLRQSATSTSTMARLLDKTFLSLPVLKTWYKKKITHQWLHTLGLLLQSGLNAFESFSIVNSTINSHIIKQAFIRSEEILHQGNTLYGAIKENPWIDDQSKHFINTGEAAGKLSDMLLHSARLSKEKFTLLEDQLLTWIPRIIYFLVLASLAANVLNKKIVPDL